LRDAKSKNCRSKSTKNRFGYCSTSEHVAINLYIKPTKHGIGTYDGGVDDVGVRDVGVHDVGVHDAGVCDVGVHNMSVRTLSVRSGGRALLWRALHAWARTTRAFLQAIQLLLTPGACTS
jgi:hypothetical protein